MKAGTPRKAAAEFLIVVNFHNDRELKPLALWKLIQALESSGDKSEAGKYRRELESAFPDWKAPAR